MTTLADQFVKEFNGATMYFTEEDNLLVPLRFDSETAQFIKR